jgi:predicted N-acyltransferase
VPALIEAALAEGAEGGADFILVQNFTSTRGPAAAELRRRGFALVSGPPSAVVDLPYDSFDEYLGAMRAQYRRRAQQTLKRSASLTVEHLTRFDHLADELARLWRCIYERAREVKREILTPDFFRLVSEVEEVTVLLTRRPDDSIASFALLVADEPWLSFAQCGFETDAGRGEGAYFRLLYEIVRHAIDNGYEQVDLGITTLAPKLDVGGVPVPVFAWLRHGNRLAQRVIRGLADSPLMRPTELEPRHVFKQPPASAAEIVERRRLVV